MLGNAQDYLIGFIIQMKIPLLLLLTLLFVAAVGLPSLPQIANCLTSFKEWKRTHNIEYAAASEDLFRFMIFSRNLREIEEHNSQESGYKLGLNQFSAMTRS